MHSIGGALLSLCYHTLQRLAPEPPALQLCPARTSLLTLSTVVKKSCRNSHPKDEFAWRQTDRWTARQMLCSRVCSKHFALKVAVNTTHPELISGCKFTEFTQILGVVSNRAHQWSGIGMSCPGNLWSHHGSAQKASGCTWGYG